MRLRISLAAVPPLVFAGALVAASPGAADPITSAAFSGNATGSVPNVRLTDLLIDRPFTCVSTATIWTLAALFSRYGPGIDLDNDHPKGGQLDAASSCTTSVNAFPTKINVTAVPTQAPPPPPPPPPPAPTPAPPKAIPARAPVVITASPPATSTVGDGCAAAVAYLTAHAAPGFTFVCPGYALGHEAMTCDNYPSICPGEKVIIINDPCPVAYMNEASNSWVVEHLSSAPIDPYGAGCTE
jgi:hypothetical protein